MSHFPSFHNVLIPVVCFLASISLQQLWLYPFRLLPHLTYTFFFLFFFSVIEVQLIYSVVLAPGVQQSDYIYTQC